MRRTGAFPLCRDRDMRGRGASAEENIMKWRIGDVTVTKIVELEVTGGSRFILPQATYEAVLPISWLQPHFADERGRLKMSIHALVVETPERRIDRRYLPRQRQAGPPHPELEQSAGAVSRRSRRCGLPARVDRHGVVHTSACRSCRVEHDAGGRPNGTRTWVPTFPNARYLMGRVEFYSLAGNARARGHECGLCRLGRADPRGRPCRSGRDRPPRLRRDQPRTDGRAHAGACQRADQLVRRGGADHRRLHAPPLPDRAARLVLGGRQRPGRGAPHPRAHARRIVRQAGPGDRHAFRRRDGRSYRPRRRHVPAGV